MVGVVAPARPMKALTVGSTSTVAWGTAIATPPPPNALPVASASARPIADTMTSPAIPTGSAGSDRSPTSTASPIHAEAVGVLREVVLTTWIVIAPPLPETSDVSAPAPAISAFTLTPTVGLASVGTAPARVIVTPSPT